MAQRVHISLTDDLLGDDTPADETLTFALDGATYEIDLSAENAAKMREVLGPYVANARKVSGGRRAGGRRGRSAASSASANEIRAWAREQGMEVSDRGRVRDEIKVAYEAAHR